MVAVRMARCPVWAIGGVLGTPPSNGAKVFGQRRPEGAARSVFLHCVAAWPLLSWLATICDGDLGAVWAMGGNFIAIGSLYPVDSLGLPV